MPIFVLIGIVIADSIINKEFLSAGKETIPRHYIYYLLILFISFIFVVLRWSNLTLSPLAFFKDTPVAPTGQRISFGIIFPVVELALFSLSPLYYLLLKRQPDLRRILIAFLSGQSLSIIYSLFQRLQEKVSPEPILRGMASDPTAFGFLSALGLFLAWYLYSHYAEKWQGLFFIFVSLIGIMNSVTRIGILAVILIFFLFIFSGRKKVFSFILICILFISGLLLYMQFFHQSRFNILTRLKYNFQLFDNSLKQKKIDSNPLRNYSVERAILWQYSSECLKSFPVTGVGTGNFVFWVMYAHNGDFLHHLPANQYFFISSSTGLLGLLIFLFFCSGLFAGKKWPEKLLLGAFLFLLIFNDYLWFSEIFLVFWLFASLGEKSEEKPLFLSKRAKILYIGGFLIFIIFNLLNFSSQLPKNWAREASTPYDYGFSYPETERGHTFHWSGEKAGIYLFLDKDNRKAEYKLVCGAPLSRLPGKRQSVDVYWRGKLYRQIFFRENGEYLLQVEDASHSEGFLEFRVRPAFNLKKMGLGAETRDLGIQVSGPGL
ncbi:MAG: O-antigen ligase family protein [Candidatus Aminicenantes bacterium]|nr:O-antigen ligase family protein [Candidatus Aminicenantes bacterium]